jgi:hypothetical protein
MEHITELFTKHFMSIAPDSVNRESDPSRRSGYVTIDSIGYKAANMAYGDFWLFRFVLEEVFPL